MRVKDTGTGISAEDQQKLFAPFTRVGGVDTSKITGTGLGMDHQTVSGFAWWGMLSRIN